MSTENLDDYQKKIDLERESRLKEYEEKKRIDDKIKDEKSEKIAQGCGLNIMGLWAVILLIFVFIKCVG